jgi:peptidoglycan/xylan/chitin deacetylase (PgdA/CDA1 family)
LKQLRDSVRGAASLPERAFVITFDDGLREQHEHAWPILRKLGIPAIFFVNTAPVAEGKVLSVHKIHLLRSQVAPARLQAMFRELAPQFDIAFDPAAHEAAATRLYRYDTPGDASLKYFLNFTLDWRQRDRLVEACFARAFGAAETQISRELYMDVAQMQELAAADCLGNHTHDHLPLGLLPDDEAAAQIGRAAELLEAWTHQRPAAMSYPYGSQNACTPRTGRVAEEQGVELAFTMERAGNADFAAPLFLARFDCNDVPGGKSWRGNDDTFFETVSAARWYRPPQSV